MSRPDSKRRLLEAATRLFGERGYEAASLRAITQEAGVNLAAVSYHFGSKEGLLRAVLEDLVGPVNQERLARLDALEAGHGVPEIAALLDAFVRPAMGRMGTARDARVRLVGRALGEVDSLAHGILMQQFDEVRRRFVVAFRRALPHLDDEELHWRMHFVIGTMIQTMTQPERLRLLSDGRFQVTDVETALRYLLGFATAGLAAPPTPPPAPAGSAPVTSTPSAQEPPA